MHVSCIRDNKLTYIHNAIQLPVTQPKASLFLVFTYTVTLPYTLAGTTPQLCSVAYTSALYTQCTVYAVDITVIYGHMSTLLSLQYRLF